MTPAQLSKEALNRASSQHASDQERQVYALLAIVYELRRLNENVEGMLHVQTH